MIGEARDLLNEVAGTGQGPLEAIGVAAPGPVERRTGVLLNPPNLPGWRDVPLAQVLEDAFGVPVRVENDANAAAMAEHRFGAGRGTLDMIYLTMSTGVGGGVISGGRLVQGANGFAGELGHIPIVRNGAPLPLWAARLPRGLYRGAGLVEAASAQRARIEPDLRARRRRSLAHRSREPARGGSRR